MLAEDGLVKNPLKPKQTELLRTRLAAVCSAGVLNCISFSPRVQQLEKVQDLIQSWSAILFFPPTNSSYGANLLKRSHNWDATKLPTGQLASISSSTRVAFSNNFNIFTLKAFSLKESHVQHAFLLLHKYMWRFKKIVHSLNSIGFFGLRIGKEGNVLS